MGRTYVLLYFVLLGDKNLFWTATEYNEADKRTTALIGQCSLTDSNDAKFTAIRFTDLPNVKGSNEPQIIRTPDGYIHVFIGVTYDIGNPNLHGEDKIL